MTQSVTVQTDFRDLQQMAEGLVGRVHATHVILPAADSVDEGAWAQWAIALHDGSAGLAGVGRCVTVVDNGEEREAHQRFDVVFDSLQFDDHEQRVFEHILALHGSGDAEVIEEAVDVESIRPQTNSDHSDAFVDVSTDFTGNNRVQLNDNDAIPDEKTMVASEEELVPAPGGGANDIVPQRPAAQVSHATLSYGNQSAAVAHAVQTMEEEQLEEPLSGERIAPQSRPVNGAVFAYANGIPFPAKPPRPDLEPSMRVTPAPRPAGLPEH
ncbi:MAG TPA: hypothetical protein VFX59_04520 [Polyangiales bacterium]|nr:hypothetical protein [Polyangiales bacterium]